MKNNKILSITLLAIFILVNLPLPILANNNLVNDNLENQIERFVSYDLGYHQERLNKKYFKLTKEQKEKILYLDLELNNNDDLSILKEYPNLEDLTLTNKKNHKLDFKVFKELKKLKLIRLNRYNNVDFTNVSNLENLELNNFKGNLSKIKEIEKLTYLKLSNMEIDDLSFLNDMRNLNILEINCSNIKNFKSLENNKNIYYLTLNNSKIDNYMPIIETFKSLNGLELKEMGLEDFDYPKNEHIKMIVLEGNKIKDVSKFKQYGDLVTNQQNKNVNVYNQNIVIEYDGKPFELGKLIDINGKEVFLSDLDFNYKNEKYQFKNKFKEIEYNTKLGIVDKDLNYWNIKIINKAINKNLLDGKTSSSFKSAKVSIFFILSFLLIAWLLSLKSK